MKKVLLKKLRSNEGASLTYAILLFLVCAVVGSIVLTAGTIASGRLAEKAQMDQRYYHVVSTAEFLKDTLEGKSVVIIREKDPSSIRVDGYIYDETNPPVYDFLTERTLELFETDDGAIGWDADFFSTTSKTKNYEFQIAGYDTFSPDIHTEVVDGKLYLDITDDNYTVRMTFVPKVSEIISLIEKESTDGSSVSEVETKTSTVTWHVDSIEKVFG